MKLYDLFDLERLEQHIAEGFVKRTMHPSLPLAILNYTPKTQYSRTWDHITKSCRGLIYNVDTAEIKARPFQKFFNLGELLDEEVPKSGFDVLEKMDGSLGILYPTNDEYYAIATRGSFTSEQAEKATAMYLARYHGEWQPRPDFTYLFEIIYPSNRIVVDYGDLNDLVLLDIVHSETGTTDWTNDVHGWPGPRVKKYPDTSITDLLAAPQPANAEGYVLRFDTGERVKIKHDEYVRLHRILTGVSTKTVWEYLKDGLDLSELLDKVPDEFYEWVKAEAAKLRDQFTAIERQAKSDFGIAHDAVHVTRDIKSEREFRKAFAGYAMRSPYSDILFKIMDGKDYTEAIWKRLKPDYERPFNQQSEDVA